MMEDSTLFSLTCLMLRSFITEYYLDYVSSALEVFYFLQYCESFSKVIIKF